MLASPLPSSGLPIGDWSAEEKFDGHRLILAVDEDQMFVRAWSRNGIVRPLSEAMLSTARTLPPGTYDGELIVPGGTSTDVTALNNVDKLRLVLFDILSLRGDSLTHLTQHERSVELEAVIRYSVNTDYIDTPHAVPHITHAEALTLAASIWERGGEGLILKASDAKYTPSKRSRDWIKIKRLQTAVLAVTGFAVGELGPHSILLLIDEDGNRTAVKWKNLEWLAEARSAAPAAGVHNRPHPWIGRRARIEFQSRTTDGSYRHPRFDRWEER